MNTSFASTWDNPILVAETRGPIIENVHRGAYCIVDVQGQILHAVGNWQRPTFVRSALKYFQQIPLVESGAYRSLKITPQELAVACASHSGEYVHIRWVQRLLHKVGLSEKHLQCGTHPPFDRPTRHELIRKGQTPSPIHNNCSGKHAAFLALCVYGGYSTHDYLDVNHPVQVMIRQAIASIMEISEDSLIVGTDGCSAPNYAMPLNKLALGFARLAAAEVDYPHASRETLQIIRNAVIHNPYLIAGRNRYCTLLMQQGKPHIIGKTGAAGVYGFGLTKRSIGGAVKIDDGTSGTQYLVTQGILYSILTFPEIAEQIKPLNEQYFTKVIVNWSEKVTGSYKFIISDKE